MHAFTGASDTATRSHRTNAAGLNDKSVTDTESAYTAGPGTEHR